MTAALRFPDRSRSSGRPGAAPGDEVPVSCLAVNMPPFQGAPRWGTSATGPAERELQMC